METIKNYLESMFASLPNLPEILRAKDELEQMMEDKYNEFLSEGKNENEAVGIVISEFGNLEEVSEALGIEKLMRKKEQGVLLSAEKAGEFISDRSREGILRGLGFFLLLISPLGKMTADLAGTFSGLSGEMEAAGSLANLLCCILGTGLLIYAAKSSRKWDFLNKQRFHIDYATAISVNGQAENYHHTYTLLYTAGCLFCMLCFVPAVFVYSLDRAGEIISRSSWILLFILLGTGVFLLTAVGAREKAFRRILFLNESGLISGNFVKRKKPKEWLSLYWPTVICLFLCLGFLTFEWGRVLLIWPFSMGIYWIIKIFGGTQK